MSFTRKEQVLFRQIVAAAWEAHCRAEGVVYEKPEPARDAWRRDEMRKAVGKGSTLQCSNRSDFTTLMAHFEVIARSGIYWQMQAGSARQRHARHTLRELMRRGDFSEEYVAGIAGRMGHPSSLERLDAGQLTAVTQALRTYMARHEMEGARG